MLLLCVVATVAVAAASVVILGIVAAGVCFLLGCVVSCVLFDRVLFVDV